ncbi:MAG TPA: glycosyltransferase family 4 protein [Solirubrobacteraceae bacterium]|nr:glycosyltransferase family 4 protein [Solirubrobacteraceae bacterium]
MPGGRVALSCSAPFAGGGLGRHLQELYGALQRAGAETTLICGPSAGVRGAAAPPGRIEISRGRLSGVVDRVTALSPALSTWKSGVDFDAGASRRLGSVEHVLAFNGQALAQLRAARAPGSGIAGASLVSATSHMRHVARQHEKAYRRYPLERPWAPRVLDRNLAEYRLADSILCSTEHIRRSFVQEGVPDERLLTFPLTPDPRYAPGTSGSASSDASASTFDVVYVGSLSVAKGVPLLVDAVRSLPAPDLRLVLLGGWASRGMRRFLQSACASDPRIAVRLGDPLEELRGARLYVHPSYDDGFGYAPAEALAAGVPVIVTEDTGMKELLEPSRGMVVPTGDGEALAAALEAAYRGEILSI